MCSLGLEQEGRLNLGQEVGSLRFFSICGLQEGYEPFAINMKRPITLWFSKSLPQFVPVPPDHPQLEVRRWGRGSLGGMGLVPWELWGGGGGNGGVAWCEGPCGWVMHGAGVSLVPRVG